MKLRLGGIAVDCIIGDLPWERERTQTLKVDVALEIGELAAATDELSDTLDYAALADKIRVALVEAKCRMIERAAKVAWDVCVREGGSSLSSVKVTVRKSGAVQGLDYAEAEYEGRIL